MAAGWLAESPKQRVPPLAWYIAKYLAKTVMKFYNVKAIQTKSNLEIYHYSKTQFYGYEEEQEQKKKHRSFDEMDAKSQLHSLQRKQKYYENKRYDIRRLVDMNYNSRSSFLTLTQDPKRNGFFGDNVKEGNYQFELFIKRLKYYLKKNYPKNTLKYLACWEYQKNAGIYCEKGNLHYHIILFDFPFIDVKVLAKLWGHGTIQIHRIDKYGKDKAGLYVSKYFAKDLDVKQHKQKAYFTSRNLKKPEIFKINDNDFNIKTYGEENYKSKYKIHRKTANGYEDVEVEYFNIPLLQNK